MEMMAGIFDPHRAMRCMFAVSLVFGTLLVAAKAWPEEQSGPGQLAALPSSGRFEYDVIREGDRIGTHSVMFRREGGNLAIETRTDITVRVLGITLYRFYYKAEESWVDGRLSSLSSGTDNDGEILTVALARAGGRIRGTCNGILLDLPTDLLPISVWHPDFIRRSIILDQYRCVERKVRATDHGTEPVSAGLQNVRARHYTLAGELQRDVWYGPDGQAVGVVFPANDGSEIAFVIRGSSQSPPLSTRSTRR
jgi:hypothetical protein